MQARLAVAHPDDCCIFGWPLIYMTRRVWRWSIVYLTYNESDPRAQEATDFWYKHKVLTEFLGFEDHYRDLEQGFISTFNEEEASQALQENLKDVDLIVTHGAEGEYGHIHHKFVHNVVNLMPQPKIYFSPKETSNAGVTAPTFSLNDWPLHREVIEGFKDREHGYYWVTEEAKRRQLYI